MTTTTAHVHRVARGNPVAAMIECTVCHTHYVLRWCLVLRDGGTHECYAFFPDCRAKRACEREAARRGIERKRVLTDNNGEPKRIPVASLQAKGAKR